MARLNISFGNAPVTQRRPADRVFVAAFLLETSFDEGHRPSHGTRCDRSCARQSRRDVDVFLDQPKLSTAEEQPPQLRAREHGLTYDALTIVVAQSAMTVRQTVALAILDQRCDREAARSREQLGFIAEMDQIFGLPGGDVFLLAGHVFEEPGLLLAPVRVCQLEQALRQRAYRLGIPF